MPGHCHSQGAPADSPRHGPAGVPECHLCYPLAMPEFASLLILAAAGLLQGFLGFGFGIVAMSGLTLSQDLVHAAGVVNLVGWVATSGQLWTLRAHTVWGTVRRIAPTLVLGVALGVTALRTFDSTLMVRALGITTVAIAAWNLIRPTLRAGRSGAAFDAAIGLISGVLGGAFNTGGPPLIAHLYRGPETPDQIRATIQALFLTISTSRALISASQGLFDRAVLVDSLFSIPAMGVGLLLGFALSRRVGAERFRGASWVALGVLGAVLILRA